MKGFSKTLTIFLLCSTTLFAQKASSEDSLKVAKTFQKLFAAIDSDDMEILNTISTSKIYCILCSTSPDFSETPYLYSQKDFLENYLPYIKNNELYKRATKSDELILVNENNNRTDITAYWTIYQKNELAPEHEGAQFGIYFKKVNGEYKFAGMETIP